MAPSPLPEAPPVPAEASRRVFVNRNLRFGDIQWVGFDMDYTLAPYAKRRLEALSFELTKKQLVERMSYPPEVLDIEYDPGFPARGLAIDKRLGHVIKVDRHGHVGRAYHGRKMLDKAERHQAYRNVKVSLSAARYHWVDTLFALPEVSLFADLVDLYENRLGVKKVAYKKLFEDVRGAIDACHRDGSLKSVIIQDPGQFVLEDPALPDALHKLRSSGKKLFVLTNSEWPYTDVLMKHMLEGRRPEYPQWTGYFDLVFVGARKPAFFTDHLLFHEIDPATGTPSRTPAERIEHRRIYRGGSTRELARRLPELHGERVLYVGDHIYGDIIRSKKDTLWRTALVLEELEDELLLQTRLAPMRDRLQALGDRIAMVEHEVARLKQRTESRSEAKERDELLARKRELRMLEEERAQISSRVESAFNPFWGSIFREGHEQSRFGRQVEAYACIYTSRVSNFLGYSPTQYFRTPSHWMAHEKAL